MHALHTSVEWPAWSVALAYGLASGLSFPIGAAWGVWSSSSAATAASGAKLEASTVEDSRWSAGTLAFGAGCLLFAVTVEIYGQAVADMEQVGYMKEIPYISTTIMSAMLGAWAYIVANRWVVRVVSEGFDAQQSSAALGGPDEETPLNCVAGEVRKKSLLLGYASWFGVFVSGIPEGVLLGQLVAIGRPSAVLVISLFIANFPAAVASASMMKQGGRGNTEVICLWTLVLLSTGFFAAALPICLPAALEPNVPIYVELIGDVLEGLAGGSMLASILALMLPEAYNIMGDLAGLMATAGFLFAVGLKVFGGLMSEFTVSTAAMGEATVAPHGAIHH